MKSLIKQGKACYERTKKIALPSVLTRTSDVWSFAQPETKPNFITQLSCEGPVKLVENSDSLANSIIFIPSADPGYDWIFSKNIKGFVTKYGGINSHMAIRAAELSIPAIIGMGETLYDRYSQAKMLKIDAANQTVHIIAS